MEKQAINRFDNIQDFLNIATKSKEENKLEWITNLAKKVVSEHTPIEATEAEIARCAAMLDSIRYAMADSFIEGYQGGLWDYYSATVSEQDIFFVVYADAENLAVHNHMNGASFEDLNTVTASIFIWAMTLFYVAEECDSKEAFEYAEDFKYAMFDSLPEAEVEKLMRLLD